MPPAVPLTPLVVPLTPLTPALPTLLLATVVLITRALPAGVEDGATITGAATVAVRAAVYAIRDLIGAERTVNDSQRSRAVDGAAVAAVTGRTSQNIRNRSLRQIHRRRRRC